MDLLALATAAVVAIVADAVVAAVGATAFAAAAAAAAAAARKPVHSPFVINVLNVFFLTEDRCFSVYIGVQQQPLGNL